MTNDFAQRFATEWIEAWNNHDLDKILSHYADDFEMSSPYISLIAGEPGGMLKGKAQVGAYWAQALQHMPDLHFELLNALTGVNSLSRRQRIGCGGVTFRRRRQSDQSLCPLQLKYTKFLNLHKIVETQRSRNAKCVNRSTTSIYARARDRPNGSGT